MSEKEGMLKKERLLGWREVAPGGQVMTPGNSKDYKTSDWAVRTMQWNAETCINCLLCWPTCPDQCIVVEDGQMKGVNDFYCKGCGICEKACPSKPKSLSPTGFGDGKEG